MSDPTPHPRLFARPDDFAAIDATLHGSHPVAVRARERFEADLAEACAEVRCTTPESGHNWHLMRMRELQRRLVTLMVEYLRNPDSDCRGLVVEYLRLAAGWRYWSWIDWRQNPDQPTDLYDLSFGEIGMTVALVWDWLGGQLTDEETALLGQMAQRHSTAFLRAYERGTNSWATRRHSNWTAVTCGGAGMLALTMWEELAQAEEILRRVEAAMEMFFGSLGDDGGWAEGLGYWNYGMRYGFLYLLSYEAAMGQEHPLMRRKGVRNTALFPLIFSPCGSPAGASADASPRAYAAAAPQTAGFGDSNRFWVMPFHYRLLQRLELDSCLPMLDDLAASEGGFGGGCWPSGALYGLLGPTERPQPTQAPPLPVNGLLDAIGWGYMSESFPRPRTFVSIRGGSTDVPHAQADLMAFWFQTPDEQFLVNVHDGRYVDTTFSPQRHELYGCGPLSKNTILLNGVGIMPAATSRTRGFDHEGSFVVQVDTTDCFAGEYLGQPTTRRCCRTFINLGQGRYLIVDRVRFSNEGQFEARFHTFLPIEIDCERQMVAIAGQSATAHLRFACTEPLAIRAGLSTPIQPSQPADTILQVQSEKLVPALTLVTLMDLEESPSPIDISLANRALTVTQAGESLCTIPMDDAGDPFGQL
jgi:hypothetical protein